MGQSGLESLPLSDSICLNVKKGRKKKSRTLENPSNLAFLRKYLIGVAFLTFYLWGLGVGGVGRGHLGLKMLLYSCLVFSKGILCSY